MLRKLRYLFFPAFLFSTLAVTSPAQSVLSLRVAGVATPQPDTLIVAAPLANLTSRAVTSVKIDRIELSTATLRTSLPMNVSSIRGHASEIIQADFDSKSLVPGKQYELRCKEPIAPAQRTMLKIALTRIATTKLLPGLSGCTPSSSCLPPLPARTTSAKLKPRHTKSRAVNISISRRAWIRT